MAGLIVGVLFALLGLSCLVIGVNGIKNKSLDLGSDELGPHKEERGTAVLYGCIITVTAAFFVIIGTALAAVRPDFS